jgi:hypothetical protein
MKALMHSRRGIISTLLTFMACLPFAAVSDETPISDTPAAENEVQLENVVADADILERSRGGAELNLYDIKSDGIVRDNQAYNLTTGSNYIAEGSFAGAAGFATAVQNSGNNVLIQNATIINLQVQ